MFAFSTSSHLLQRLNAALCYKLLLVHTEQEKSAWICEQDDEVWKDE